MACITPAAQSFDELSFSSQIQHTNSPKTIDSLLLLLEQDGALPASEIKPWLSIVG